MVSSTVRGEKDDVEVETLEQERTFNQRAGLMALAVLLAVGALWVATAVASGGSSPSTRSVPTGDGPGAAYIQDGGDAQRENDGSRAGREDCPNRGHGSNGAEPSSAV
jgi:hypothetical protein